MILVSWNLCWQADYAFNNIKLYILCIWALVLCGIDNRSHWRVTGGREERFLFSSRGLLSVPHAEQTQ
jgi:hypothetical protein